MERKGIHIGYWWKSKKHRVHYGMDWIDVAQDRDQWRDLVNTVMSLRFP
jgi:hypothetical protein